MYLVLHLHIYLLKKMCVQGSVVPTSIGFLHKVPCHGLFDKALWKLVCTAAIHISVDQRFDSAVLQKYNESSLHQINPTLMPWIPVHLQNSSHNPDMCQKKKIIQCAGSDCFGTGTMLIMKSIHRNSMTCHTNTNFNKILNTHWDTNCHLYSIGF